MSQLKKLPSAARKGGSAFVEILRRAAASVRSSLRSALRILSRSVVWLRRARVPIMVTSFIVLSYFLGYLNGLDGQLGSMDTSVPGSGANGEVVDISGQEGEGVAGDSGSVSDSGLPGRPEHSGSIAVLPIDGELVSGPDWVKDPVTGDWFYSYEVLMESKTSGTVRSALPGVIRSVTNDGEGWIVNIGHEDGSTISYCGLAEADVGPGLAVARGQRIGLAVETGSGFRVSLNATAAGEPCSAMDLIQ